MNKEATERISCSEYKDVLLNNKYLRHLMSRIQSKNHKIEPKEINKKSLSSFNDKIYILSNGYDALALCSYC